MKEKKKKISNHTVIIVLIMSVTMLIKCTSNMEKVDSIALVVPDTYEGPVVIYFDQKVNKGRIEIRKGKYFFYVDSTGVFFIQKKLEKGGAVLEGFSPNLDEDIHLDAMSINNYPGDNDFKIVGGTYGGFKTKFYKDSSEFLKFCVFKTGKVKDLKNGGWYVSDSLVIDLYHKYIGLTKEGQE